MSQEAKEEIRSSEMGSNNPETTPTDPNQDEGGIFQGVGELVTGVTNLMTPAPATTRIRATTPPPAITTTKPISVWAPTKPKMGGLLPIGREEFMAWTGGEPKLNWEGLASATVSFISAAQYRPVGHKSIQAHVFRIKGLKPKFDRTSELHYDNRFTKLWDFQKIKIQDFRKYMKVTVNNPSLLMGCDVFRPFIRLFG